MSWKTRDPMWAFWLMAAGVTLLVLATSMLSGCSGTPRVRLDGIADGGPGVHSGAMLTLTWPIN